MFTNLTYEQYEQLMKPLNTRRVSSKTGGRGKRLSFLEVWDVKAHLIRVFGFGGWSWAVTETKFVYETEDPDLDDNGKQKERNGVPLTQWNVAYSALGTLTIHQLNAQYAEAAVGHSKNPQRGEAHDNALKNAESDAIKRAAINLGTQFGLSLYNDGNLDDVVKATLIVPTLGQTETEE